MDRSEKGADVKRIEEILSETMKEENIEEEDYVIIEGGGSGLLWIEEGETLKAIERMVKKVTSEVKSKVILIKIPMRRGREKGRFGELRRYVNKQCLEKLEEWGCDGLKLWEETNWEKVWARDGIHLRVQGKEWMAMMVEKWIRYRSKEEMAKGKENGKR